MSKIIVLIGAPGAGKGTQARLLEERKGIPQISTGDMFREMKNSDTELAKKVQSIMAAGKLVPDEVTFEMVKDRTEQEKRSYILDGFPRTAVQAEMLEALAESQDKEISAIEIEIPKDDLMKRLTGRRSCPVCGEIYNIYTKPPINENFCDIHPDSELIHRADDYDDKVKIRLKTFEEQTKPLIEYYQRTGRLNKLNGQGDTENIYAQLESLI